MQINLRDIGSAAASFSPYPLYFLVALRMSTPTHLGSDLGNIWRSVPSAELTLLHAGTISPLHLPLRPHNAAV